MVQEKAPNICVAWHVKIGDVRGSIICLSPLFLINTSTTHLSHAVGYICGLFRVLEKIGKLAYRLELPETWEIHKIVSIAHLEPTPAEEDPYHRVQPHPPPVEIEGEEE